MTQVIINDVTPREQFTASGGQTVFNTLFTADATTDINVYVRAGNVAADDVTQIVNTADYTVTFIGALATTRVTFVAGQTAGDIITIVRNTPSDRENLYINTNFTPSMLNQDFGLLTLIDQQNQMYDTVINPGYNVSATINGVVDKILPVLAANQFWAKNNGDTAIVAYDIPSAGIAPADAKYLIQTANASLPNAQDMSSLATGIVKNTTTTGVQSISAPISSLDSIGMQADRIAYGTGVNTYALTTLTTYSRGLLTDTTASSWRTDLGLAIGTDVQAWDAGLQSIAGLVTVADEMIYTTASDVYATTTLTAFSRTLLDDPDATSWLTTLGLSPTGAYFLIANNLSEGVPATMRTNLGLVIGTDVQAWDATLQSLSALGTGADKIAYTTGVDTWAETTLTSYMRTLLDDTNAATAAVTLAVLPLAGGTMTGDLFLNGDPTVGSQAATKSYVDSVSLNQQLACLCASTVDLAGYTYLNGVLGVGATLTAGSFGVFTIDGVTPTINQRILIKNQTSTFQNGAYTITTLGTAGVAAILTRATDYDQSAEMQAGDQFSVVSGTVWSASQWMMSQTGAITVGTTAITFVQMSGAGALLKANNLSDLSSVGTARTNLGLVIGTNVQAYDATLQSISNLGTAANKTLYTTGVDTWAETDINAFGRTAINLTPSLGGVVYSTATVPAILAGTATASQHLQSGASAAPSWTTSTYANTYAASTLLYSNGANTVTGLATANSASLVTTVAGVPVWSSTMTNGQLIIGSTGGTPTSATLTAGTGISIVNGAGTITLSATNSAGVEYSLMLMGG